MAVTIDDIPGLSPKSTDTASPDAPAQTTTPAAPAAPPAAPTAPPAAPTAPPAAPPTAPPAAPAAAPLAPPTTAPALAPPPAAAPVAEKPAEGAEAPAEAPPEVDPNRCPATGRGGRQCVKEVGHEKKHYYGPKEKKPAEEKVPNEATQEAIKEAEGGGGVTTATPEKCVEELNSEDKAPAPAPTNVLDVITAYEENLKAQLTSIAGLKDLMVEHQKLASKVKTIFNPLCQ